jgi:phosphoserine phosphatase
MKSQIKERDDLLGKIRQIKDESSKLRGSVRELNNKKRDIINTIKTKNTEANSYRRERDKLNAKIKSFKKEREKENSAAKELIEKFKKLKEGTPGGDFRSMQKELQVLEWKLQTSVMEVKKEDDLVKRIDTLQKELAGYEDLIEISKTIDKHRKRSQKFHQKILDLSEESQKHHEKFLPVVESIKKLEAEIDDTNKKKAELTPDLDRYNEELDTHAKKLKEVEAEIKKIEVEAEAVTAGASEKELEDMAKTVYEKFKNGEKLGLDDIYLLRRFNLV